MAKNYNYITLDSLIYRFLEEYELQQENVSMSLLKEQATDIAKDFLTVDSSKLKITVLSLNNTRARLPKDFHTMVSVAYRVYQNKKDCTTVKRISEYTQYVNSDCDLKIKVDCRNCGKTSCDCKNTAVEIDVDYITRMQNPWFYNPSQFGRPVDTDELFQRNKKDTGFKILRYTTNPYHNANYHLPDCINLHCKDCDHSYSINMPFIEVDFTNQDDNVELLVAYLGKHTGENGDLLVPDITDCKEAILYGLAYSYFRRNYITTGNQQSRVIYTESEAKRDRAIGRAKTYIAIPDPEEFKAQMHDILGNTRPRVAGPTTLRTKTGKDRLIY